VSDPRHAAIETLREIDRTCRTAKQVWDGARAGAETALVLGVLRRRGTLDAVLAAYSTRKLPLIKPPTLAILRAGLYELLYMGDSPVHAVVNASVESVKRLGRYKDLGFVNAMLRSIARGRKHDLVFTRSVFPNPEHDPAGYLAARGSTALWIARRRHAELGLERALKVLDLQASTPPLFVRSDIELDLPAGPNPGLYIADARLGDLFERFGSHIVVQDAVASQVAPFVAPAAGSRVLDYCSAPGGKATHLAQLVGPEGHVSAWDASAERHRRAGAAARGALARQGASHQGHGRTPDRDPQARGGLRRARRHPGLLDLQPRAGGEPRRRRGFRRPRGLPAR
jgi:16S rRNA (cytosine967-C5)-methyltransferase